MSVEIIELKRANERQCLDMIDYFLKVNATESVIAYTNRLYWLLEMQNTVTKMTLNRFQSGRMQ